MKAAAEYVYRDTVGTDAYLKLRDAVGWSRIHAEQAEAGLRNSKKVVACYVDGECVACARLLWDGGYIAYLADVMVAPAFQGRGIGTEMVSRLIDHLRAQLKPGWRVKIVLVATQGREPFYRAMGFCDRPNAQGGAGMDLWLEA